MIWCPNIQDKVHFLLVANFPCNMLKVLQSQLHGVLCTAPDKALISTKQQVFFLFLRKSICCRYSLEAPR